MASTSTSSSASVSASSSNSSMPPLIKDATDAEGDYYDVNYERAFEHFYMYKQLNSVAAAHFAGLAADRYDCEATEEELTRAAAVAVLSGRECDEKRQWDPMLPDAVRSRLDSIEGNTMADHLAVLLDWMYTAAEGEADSAWQQNYDVARAYLAEHVCDTTSARQMHALAELMANYCDAYVPIHRSEVHAALSQALRQEYATSGKWSEHLPHEIRTELCEICHDDDDYKDELEEWLGVPADEPSSHDEDDDDEDEGQDKSEEDDDDTEADDSHEVVVHCRCTLATVAVVALAYTATVAFAAFGFGALIYGSQ